MINYKGSYASDTIMFTASLPSTTSTSNSYFGFDHLAETTTEANHAIQISDKFRLKHITCTVLTNSRTSSLNMAWRDDGGGGGFVTITNGTTGVFASNNIDVEQAANSLSNMSIPLSIGTGTLHIKNIFIQGEILD